MLEAKEEALSAAAQMCALQQRGKRLQEDEERESANASREAVLLRAALADHRKVQVLSQTLGSSLHETHHQQLNVFKEAANIPVLQDLRAKLKESSAHTCAKTALENIGGTWCDA